MTFGYITKSVRIKNNLPKSHKTDALCISGNPLAKPLQYWYLIEKKRCQNRQIHKAKILKGGKKRVNQSPYKVFGFRLFDKVKYKNNECFIFGRRNSGYFNIRTLDGIVVGDSISYKKLELIEARKSFLWERK
jgi:N6-L-threonylcarbamoyladenine synthase